MELFQAQLLSSKYKTEQERALERQKLEMEKRRQNAIPSLSATSYTGQEKRRYVDFVLPSKSSLEQGVVQHSTWPAAPDLQSHLSSSSHHIRESMLRHFEFLFFKLDHKFLILLSKQRCQICFLSDVLKESYNAVHFPQINLSVSHTVHIHKKIYLLVSFRNFISFFFSVPCDNYKKLSI